MVKTCNKCGDTKPLSEFYKSKQNKDGHHVVCKVCDKELSAAWYKANRERKNEANAAWYKANRERHKELIAAWRKANKERHKDCLLYTSPSPRDKRQSRMPSSA